MQTQRPIIGRISATVNQPTTSDTFYFWLEPSQIVNPFDIVEAEQVAPNGGTSRTFGLVVDLAHSTDAPAHLSNFISSDFGQVNIQPNTVRQGTTVARVAVLANDHDIYMPVPCDHSVYFADEKAIHIALGVDTVPDMYRIPAGLIRMSNGEQAVVYLDERYVLGPEGAHVNITGISGLATKTSYIMFLIQSILQTAEKHGRRDKIAVILLNVKHGDLLCIDQPAAEMPEEQKALWGRLGLSPKPFDNVRYLLPHGKDTPRKRRPSPNSFVIPRSNRFIYAYALPDAYQKLDLLLSQIPDTHDTLSAIIGEISAGLSDASTGRWGPWGDWCNVRDWNTLLNGEPLAKDGKPQRVGDVKPASVGRFRRLLRRVVQTRQSGIFVSQRASDVKSIEEEIARIRGGEVVVVDIAKLTDDEQTLVFGDILRTLYALYAEAEEGNENLPEKVIIFVDELNKYAPAREKASPILEQVLDIAERGRSLGIVLFGAEQFMSAVHPRVVGNCATRVFGRSGSAELAAEHYRSLDPAIKGNITRMGKGELVLEHAIYRQPVKVVFPLPAYRHGCEKDENSAPSPT
jgi:hypothetical protein